MNKYPSFSYFYLENIIAENFDYTQNWKREPNKPGVLDNHLVSCTLYLIQYPLPHIILEEIMSYKYFSM